MSISKGKKKVHVYRLYKNRSFFVRFWKLGERTKFVFPSLQVELIKSIKLACRTIFVLMQHQLLILLTIDSH
jgi:hypothetical protein